MFSLNPPSTTVILEKLSVAGWQLAYHGDFDWPGLQIARHLCKRLGAKPWRMTATHYRLAPRSSVMLVGFPVPTEWDEDLAAAMAAAGHSVFEEQVIGDLLADLRNGHG